MRSDEQLVASIPAASIAIFPANEEWLPAPGENTLAQPMLHARERSAMNPAMAARFNVGDVFRLTVDSQRVGFGQIVGRYRDDAYYFAIFEQPHEVDEPLDLDAVTAGEVGASCIVLRRTPRQRRLGNRGKPHSSITAVAALRGSDCSGSL